MDMRIVYGLLRKAKDMGYDNWYRETQYADPSTWTPEVRHVVDRLEKDNLVKPIVAEGFQNLTPMQAWDVMAPLRKPGVPAKVQTGLDIPVKPGIKGDWMDQKGIGIDT